MTADQFFRMQLDDQTAGGIHLYQSIRSALQWQDETFKKATDLSKLKHLKKEIGELIDAIENGEPEINVQHEYADCIILLLGSARKRGYDARSIGNFINEKLAINRQREWNEPDADGVVTHKK